MISDYDILERNRVTVPHPFSDWESLQCEILGVLKDEEGKVEDGSEPVELVLVDVGTFAVS